LGKTPHELGVKVSNPATSWNELEQDKEAYKNAEAIKNMFAISFFNRLISGAKQPNEVKITPSYIVNKLIKHCENLTKSSRDFMERNPTIPLPKDFQLYPGKMDHTTCVAFKVGVGEVSDLAYHEMSAKTRSAPVHHETNRRAESSPWKEYETDKGEVYFYNTITGESVWEDPFLNDKSSDWKAYYDSNQDIYFYNSKTGESRWDLNHPN
jgi:hypothetical protein